MPPDVFDALISTPQIDAADATDLVKESHDSKFACGLEMSHLKLVTVMLAQEMIAEAVKSIEMFSFAYCLGTFPLQQTSALIFNPLRVSRLSALQLPK